MTDEERFFYNHGYKQAERDFIKELEKIKAEIEKMRSKQNCSCSDCLDIIDKYLYELKGE